MKSPHAQDELSKVVKRRADGLAAQPEPWLAALLDQFAHAAPPGESMGKSELLERAYQEYCERREAGEPINADSYCAQFPHLQNSLGRLIRAHRWLEDNPQLLGDSPPVRWPEPGEVFLGFRLQRELGRGAFARVFLATEPALGDRQVAVKISPGGAAEAHTLGRINHPNIVPVHSVQKDVLTGLTAVCMPYLGSATLCDLLDRVNVSLQRPLHRSTNRRSLVDSHRSQEPLPATAADKYVDHVRRIGAQLADALTFIHQRKICHRDLKPSNVLLTSDGRPMLLDFNLSADAESGNAGLGGTLPYMSPEQLLATDPQQAAATVLDARSDLFSLGVMLYELLTGRHPFGPLPLELPLLEARRVLLARQQISPAPVRRLNAAVDPILARVVERCLARDPRDRPQSAAEVAIALRRPQSLLQRLRGWIVRHPWATVAAMFLAVGVVIGAAAAWSQREPEATREWRLGRTAYQERQYDAAVRHLSRLDELQPGRADVLVARARAYQQWGESEPGKFRQALDDYQNANKIVPDGLNHACIGYIILRTDAMMFARTHLENATGMGFGSGEHFNNVGYWWLKQGNPDRALQYLDMAIERRADLQAAYHNRALARFLLVSREGYKSPLLKSGKRQFRDLLRHYKFLANLTLVKADMRKALATGPASQELCRDCAQVWAIAAGYDPSDCEPAVKFLASATARGLVKEEAKEVFANTALKGVAIPVLHLQASAPIPPGLVVDGGAVPPPIPTTRIVDPLHD